MKWTVRMERRKRDRTRKFLIIDETGSVVATVKNRELAELIAAVPERHDAESLTKAVHETIRHNRGEGKS